MDRIIITLDQEQDSVIKLLLNLPEGNENYGHKFVYTHNRELIISTTSKKKPNHGDLGDSYPNEDIEAAGWIKLNNENAVLNSINLTNRSGIYCRSFDSLKKVESFIVNLLDSVKVSLINDQNPKCP